MQGWKIAKHQNIKTAGLQDCKTAKKQQMDFEIKILCPGQKCGKCRRMVSQVEKAAGISGVNINIVLIDKLEEILTYQTWILPTLIINDKMVARGYVPGIKMIQEYFKNPKPN